MRLHSCCALSCSAAARRSTSPRSAATRRGATTPRLAYAQLTLVMCCRLRSCGRGFSFEACVLCLVLSSPRIYVTGAKPSEMKQLHGRWGSRCTTCRQVTLLHTASRILPELRPDWI